MRAPEASTAGTVSLPESGTNSSSPLLVPVLVALATTYTTLESMLGPAVPLIVSTLQTTPAAGTWVFTGLTLSAIVSTPLVTRLADVRNKRTLLLAIWAIVTVGVAAGAVSPSIQVLAVGQVLQGVGLTSIPLSIAIFRECLPAQRLRRANGALVGATSVGAAVGFLLTGPIVDSFDFRWLYRLPLVVLVVLLLAAMKAVPSLPASQRKRVDFAGAIILGLSLTTLLVGLTLAPTHGWTSTLFYVCVVVAILLFAVFVFWERRVPEPLVDLRLGGRVVLTVGAISFAVGWANMTIFITIPLVAVAPAVTGYGLGGTATLAGWLLLPMGVVGAVSATIVHRARGVLGSRGVMAASGGLLVASMLVLLVSLTLPALVIAAALMGGAIGLGLTEALNLLAESVPADRVASASGLVFMIRNAGAMFGAQIGGSILASSLLADIPIASKDGVLLVVLVAVLVALVAAFAVVILPRAARDDAGTKSKA
ncbi:MFS transporter (plasmid) [Rhodococcus globerulus]|uniref:MFS transporter n=1 Tax=Rhodococcus globerulus TaxID=33008 RepID=UPI0039EA4B01